MRFYRFQFIQSRIDFLIIQIICFQISGLERILIMIETANFFTTLSIRVQRKTITTRTIIWTFRIVTVLITWLECLTLVDIFFAEFSLVARQTLTCVWFDATATVFTRLITNCYLIKIKKKLYFLWIYLIFCENIRLSHPVLSLDSFSQPLQQL